MDYYKRAAVVKVEGIFTDFIDVPHDKVTYHPLFNLLMENQVPPESVVQVQLVEDLHVDQQENEEPNYSFESEYPIIKYRYRYHLHANGEINGDLMLVDDYDMIILNRYTGEISHKISPKAIMGFINEQMNLGKTMTGKVLGFGLNSNSNFDIKD
ncbi:hypothetical protein [Persicobacter psychrovividus]|uniref:Uncharacterized protein n=1 Tax=Persicobacter psychrovividus TaxID=387638 RepID=A0ABN6LBY3_9BACT|nr:hypothetical protein PEPS_30010 [Persicobacter psychrovividus]